MFNNGLCHWVLTVVGLLLMPKLVRNSWNPSPLEFSSVVMPNCLRAGVVAEPSEVELLCAAAGVGKGIAASSSQFVAASTIVRMCNLNFESSPVMSDLMWTVQGPVQSIERVFVM